MDPNEDRTDGGGSMGGSISGSISGSLGSSADTPMATDMGGLGSGEGVPGIDGSRHGTRVIDGNAGAALGIDGSMGAPLGIDGNEIRNDGLLRDRRSNASLAAVVDQAIRFDSERGAALAWAYLARHGVPPAMILRVLAAAPAGSTPRRAPGGMPAPAPLQ